MISRNHWARLVWMLMLLFAVAWGSGACFSASVAPKRPFVLVIDAGHGGKDAGELGRLVEKNCPDVKVIYTRKTDVFVTLQGRAEIANRNKADLFISVHTNSSPAGKAAPMGAETYTLGMHRAADNLEVAKRENSVITQESNYKQTYHNFDPRKSESYIIFEFLQDRNMQQSVDLARAIQRHYTSSGRRNKGVHQAGFLVLRATSMPSVLTELGFISNAEEEKFLHSRHGVETLARAIFDGFKAYRQKHYAQDVLSPEISHDESEAQPLVAENPPTTAPMSPLEAVRNSVTVPQPVDVSTLKAEIVPVPTRPFGQPAAPVEKSHGETTKVISLPELPPAIAASSSPIPATPPSQDSMVPVLPVSTPVSQKVETVPPMMSSTTTSAAQESQILPQEVAKAEMKVAQTELSPAKTVLKEATTDPKTAKTVASNDKVSPQDTKVVGYDAKAAKQEVKAVKQDSKVTKQETKVVAKENKETQRKENKTSQKSPEQTLSNRPIFKLQLFTIDRALRSDDRHFKGLSPVEYYEEGGRYKYTYGATANYEEAKRLQKEIADRFPDAFVVAFLNNQRTELAEAIKLSKLMPNGKN